MYSLRARYYNPALGRFLSGDTYPVNLGNPVELNRYVYAANRPINLVDPTGHFALTEGAITNNSVSRPSTPTLTKIGVFAVVVFTAVGVLLNVVDVPRVLPKIKSLEDINMERQWQEWQELLKKTKPNPGPAPDQDPEPEPTFPPPPPIVGTPTQPPKKVRVRHYSQQIDYVRSIMLIKARDGLAIWVEYPITTPYEEQAIQKTTSSFMIPLNGRGGFVEFYVDLNKWHMEPDPNLPGVKGATIIWLGGPGNMTYIGVGFPLGEPDVDPEFFDWQGNPK